MNHPNSVVSLGTPIKPVPDSDEMSWTLEAACTDMSQALFFGPDYRETAEERRFRVARAQQICASCPVAVQCLDFARRMRERHGVWGGVDMSRRASGPRLPNGYKTHCPVGHEFTEDNTYVYDGMRHCRTCRRDRAKRERMAR